MMKLDAHVLTSFQSCQRRFVLQDGYQPLRWRPKGLFDACLRRAIFQLSSESQGEKNVAEIAVEARTFFLEAAASPGLDTLGNPYVIAKDWCAMLDTIVRSLARLTLLTLKQASPVRLAPWLDWHPFSWQDDSGQLHRWITVDSWREEDFYREMHGWYVMGEMAALRQPLWLHVIEIGRQGKRRASPFARAWQHPGLPRLRLRFANCKDWNPVYLADRPRDIRDIDDWVEGMWKEGVAQKLFHHIRINLPSENVLADTQGQILLEAQRMRDLLGASSSSSSSPAAYAALPMSRGACDGPFLPCPFQQVCYNEKYVDPESTGLYKVKSVEKLQ